MSKKLHEPVYLTAFHSWTDWNIIYEILLRTFIITSKKYFMIGPLMYHCYQIYRYNIYLKSLEQILFEINIPKTWSLSGKQSGSIAKKVMWMCEWKTGTSLSSFFIKIY